MNLLWTAFLYGTFSAISFPLGAMLGIMNSPVRNDVGASFVAFGAGALLFAVTVEIYAHLLADFSKGRSGSALMWCTIAATFVGSATYLYLNRWLENAIEAREEEFIGDGDSVSNGDAKSEVSEDWAPQAQSEQEKREQAAFMSKMGQPAPAKSLNVPERPSSPAGSNVSNNSFRPVRSLRKSVMNRMHGVPSVPRKSIAKLNLPFETEVKFGKMEGRKARLSTVCTEVDVLLRGPAKHYSTIEEDVEVEKTERSCDTKEEEEKKAAGLKLGMALFLGLVVDGIPEAALLGFLVAEGYLSYVLVLSIFLANFPEAFSSASLMTEAGISKTVVMGMWSGLCLLTGVLCTAACGLIVFVGGSGEHQHKSLKMEFGIATVEGLAAGSMICCISAVMLPEAYERRNQDVLLLSSGFLCSCGFLSAVALKVLEADFHGGHTGH